MTQPMAGQPMMAPQPQMMQPGGPCPQVSCPMNPPNMQAQSGDQAYINASNILRNEPHMVRVQQLRRKRELMGCDFNNWYVVLNSQGREVFFVAENSTCIERNCCSGECKAWRMDVALIGEQGVNGPMSPFLHLERPFTLTFCCINRPKVIVTQIPSGREVGTLTDPFAFCALNTTVELPGTGPLLKAQGGLCQKGLFCPCPGCQVDFDVMDMTTLTKVANITKTWTMGDCCPILSKEWSTLDVSFGSAQEPTFKMLLMSTAVFLQMAFFDKRNQNDA